MFSGIKNLWCIRLVHGWYQGNKWSRVLHIGLALYPLWLLKEDWKPSEPDHVPSLLLCYCADQFVPPYFKTLFRAHSITICETVPLALKWYRYSPSNFRHITVLFWFSNAQIDYFADKEQGYRSSFHKELLCIPSTSSPTILLHYKRSPYTGRRPINVALFNNRKYNILWDHAYMIM